MKISMGKLVLLYWSVIILIIIPLTCAELEFQKISRELHNLYRNRHHVPPLIASDDLNTRAVMCAQYYAAIGRIDHTCPHKNSAGENLWAFGSNAQVSDEDVARNSANSWYSEQSRHNYTRDWQPASGHFSQIVWKNTKEFGFGTGRSGNIVVACGLYNPHGNVIGEFRENVLRP